MRQALFQKTFVLAELSKNKISSKSIRGKDKEYAAFQTKRSTKKEIYFRFFVYRRSLKLLIRRIRFADSKDLSRSFRGGEISTAKNVVKNKSRPANSETNSVQDFSRKKSISPLVEKVLTPMVMVQKAVIAPAQQASCSIQGLHRSQPICGIRAIFTAPGISRLQPQR